MSLPKILAFLTTVEKAVAASKTFPVGGLPAKTGEGPFDTSEDDHPSSFRTNRHRGIKSVWNQENRRGSGVSCGSKEDRYRCWTVHVCDSAYDDHDAVFGFWFAGMKRMSTTTAFDDAG